MMTGSFSLTGLVYQLPEPLLANGRFLRSEADTGQLLVWSLIAGSIIGAVSGGMFLYTKISQKLRTNSHIGLYWSLCKLHGLDRGNRQLLKEAVRFHGLTPPTRVFTEPQWLDPKGLGGELKAEANAFRRLRNRLFGEAAAATSD